MAEHFPYWARDTYDSRSWENSKYEKKKYYYSALQLNFSILNLKIKEKS